MNSKHIGNLTITENEGGQLITITVNSIPTDGYSNGKTASVIIKRDEFLDFVVDCWPEAVAYQFKTGENEQG